MSAESLGNVDPVDDGLAPLSKQLARTFYKSFQIAQGDDNIQIEALELAAHRYASQHPVPVLQSALEAARAATAPRIPAWHTPQVEGSIVLQFTNHWRGFGRTLSDVKRPYDPASSHTEVMLGSLAGLLVARDQHYMQAAAYNPASGKVEAFAGRPVGNSKRDPRQSFVRDYVLESKSLGDPTLDSVLADTRQLLVSTQPGEVCATDHLERVYTTGFGELAAAWEAHHPGQQFIDPAAYIGSRLLASVDRSAA